MSAINWEQDLIGALGIALGVLGVFLISEMARRRGNWEAERTRKLSHGGAGLVVLGLPFCVNSPGVVWGLAVAMLIVLWLGKHMKWLQSIHGVTRKTSGAFVYPLAIALVFQLSEGDPLLFSIPVLILAIADSSAAYVGQEKGQVVYRVLEGERSLEGSVTFFGLAFLIVLGGLSVSNASVWPDALMVAFSVAVMTTAVESISIRGSDNLLIPYVGWLVLERSMRLGLEELMAWVLGILLALTVVVLTAKRARLTVAGTVAIFVLLTFSYALGGAMWVAPWLVLYGVKMVLATGQHPFGYDTILPATVAGLVVLLVHVHTGNDGLYVPYLVTVGVGAFLGRTPGLRRLVEPPLKALLAGGLSWVLLSV